MKTPEKDNSRANAQRKTMVVRSGGVTVLGKFKDKTKPETKPETIPEKTEQTGNE